MSAEMLAGIAGAILSLLFSYVPNLQEAYGTLDGKWKRFWMLVALLVVTVGVFLLSCTRVAGDLGLDGTCDQAGAVALVKIFVAALIANQSAFLISPQVKPVKAADWQVL